MIVLVILYAALPQWPTYRGYYNTSEKCRFFQRSFGLLGEKNLLFKFDHPLYYTLSSFSGKNKNIKIII